MTAKILGSLALFFVASVAHAKGLIMTPPVSSLLGTQQFVCQASNNHPTKIAQITIQVVDFNGEVIQERSVDIAPLASALTNPINGGLFNNDLPARCVIKSTNLGSKRLAGTAAIWEAGRLQLAVPAVAVPQ